MRVDRKRALFAVVLILLNIAFLELALGLLAFVSPRVNELLESPRTAAVPDSRLGHRPNPGQPDHDSKGFRNPEVPARAHIVALGDSQTYGTNVEPKAAWPRQLEAMTGAKVYGMAFGGYGPVHSLMLWEEAVVLQPRIVIEAFYAGNDLFDSFDLTYNKVQLPHLKSADPRVQERVREAEESDPIARRIAQMFQMGPTPAARLGTSLRKLVSEHSNLYGLLRRASYESTRLADNLSDTPRDKWDQAKAFAEAHPAYCQVFDGGRFKTVFTSEYRLAALDLEDPRIAEGLQISLRAIQTMHELAAARNIRFLVVLIPSKETVFSQLWLNPSASYRRLTENEERFRNITRNFFERGRIEYLDSLPVLREQFAAGIQPFFVSHEGHLNEHGQKAIARLVAAHLESPGTSATGGRQHRASSNRHHGREVGA